LPHLAPGRSLAFVTLPNGQDPDDLVRSAGPQAFEALLAAAQPLADRIWHHELAAEPLETPEARAGLKRRLSDLAATIQDGNVRHEYVAEFRNRFDAHFAPAPRSFSPRTPFKPGKPGQRWQPPEPPPGPATQALGATGIDRVLAKAVLAGLIRHPAEIARHMETLSSLRLADNALGRLFEAVVDVALEDQALDTARLRTILAASGFDSVASELLRADTLPFTFTQKEWDAGRASLDLGEAIAVLAARPQVDAALAEATAAVQARFSDEAFERQVALVRRKAELESRLANLMLADDD
jgi:DNA primase